MAERIRNDKIRLWILPTGTMHEDLSWLLMSPNRQATAHNPQKMRDWIASPTHVVYIEHPDGKRILWDTGVPRDWVTRWGRAGLAHYFPLDGTGDDEWLDARLDQLKLHPGEIDYLLLSHLHLDHAGNAKLWHDTPTKIIVGEEEKRGALSFDGYNLGAHIRSDYADLHLDTVSEDTEILPGVTLLHMPGHTWGTLSLKVDLADSGTMIFTSDAVYLREAMGPPIGNPGTVYDSISWLASVEKLRRIAEEESAMLVFGHDAEQFAALATGIDNVYT